MAEFNIKASKDWHWGSSENTLDVPEHHTKYNIELKAEILAQASDIELKAVTAIENIVDGICTFWVEKTQLTKLMNVLKNELVQPFDMCFDLTGIDETTREHRAPHLQDFTVSYHLRSYQRNQDIRIKVALPASDKSAPTVVSKRAHTVKEIQ